jgi:hypothetical protein
MSGGVFKIGYMGVGVGPLAKWLQGHFAVGDSST